MLRYNSMSWLSGIFNCKVSVAALCDCNCILGCSRQSTHISFVYSDYVVYGLLGSFLSFPTSHYRHLHRIVLFYFVSRCQSSVVCGLLLCLCLSLALPYNHFFLSFEGQLKMNLCYFILSHSLSLKNHIITMIYHNFWISFR
jgi:hypothetical protein